MTERKENHFSSLSFTFELDCSIVATLKMISLLILLGGLIFLIRRKLVMTKLRRCGIDGPEPNLISGNINDFLNKTIVEKYTEYVERFGKTCGFYIGKKMNIITIDLELLRRIQIKDFDKFCDRQLIPLKHGLRPNPKFTVDIINARGKRWKDMRKILNPTFSAMKLKTMAPIMESSIDIFIEKMLDCCRREIEFNIYEDFQLLTADIITKSALGIDTDVQNDSNNRYYQAAKKLFEATPSKFLLMFMCFPEMDFFLYPFRRLLEIINEILGKSNQVILGKLVETAIRMRENKRFNDLLQLMLDASFAINSFGGEKSLPEVSSEKSHFSPSSKISLRSYSKAILSKNEIIANCNVFYEAGYETTSSALAFITHFLVNKPEIQDKVRAEMMEVHATEGEFTYDSVNKLSYLQCVINETLRYYPPVISFTRHSNEDYRYQNITIPKDSAIKIASYQIHHCEEYWPNHNVFDPERFRDKKSYDPIAFQGFGNGPRNCIGVRFAMFEIKLALCKLLTQFKLLPGPRTEKELTVESKLISETPKYGVFVRLAPIE